jgi:hypothetical protein
MDVIFQEDIDENEILQAPVLIVGYDKLTTQSLHTIINSYNGL